MSDPEHMYWDSCVFFRYLTNQPFDYVDDIHRFVCEARNGEHKIYSSSLVLTEVRQFALKASQHKSVADFFHDLRRAVFLVDPNPNILIKAGELKDIPSINPGDPNANKRRVVGTADAIHLATALYLKEVRGISDIIFHTFDDGKGSTWEGKCIPLLSFQRWYPEPRKKIIEAICDLPRTAPKHPNGGLFSGAFSQGTSVRHQSPDGR